MTIRFLTTKYKIGSCSQTVIHFFDYKQQKQNNSFFFDNLKKKNYYLIYLKTCLKKQKKINLFCASFSFAVLVFRPITYLPSFYC